jgi:hypothetical protein
MPHRNAQRRAALSVRLEKATQRFWGAFVQAIDETGASYPRIADSMGVTVNTISNYVNKRTDVNGIRAAASHIIGERFLHYVCVHDHPAPYVARARKRGRKP